MSTGARPAQHPRLVLLFSGKRKSGKDYITDLLKVNIERNRGSHSDLSLSLSLQEKIGEDAVIVRLSGPLKECYARDHGLDFEKMLSASDYKEKYCMISFDFSHRCCTGTDWT